MKRIIASVLIVIIALVAVIVQRQTSDDRVVLVGYGKSPGWSGTEYITESSEQTRDCKAVELAVYRLYDAINTYDSNLLDDISTDTSGKWHAVLDEAEASGLTYKVEKVGVPHFDGNRCEVEVTTTGMSAKETAEEIYSTQIISLVRQNTNAWAIE